MNNKGFAVTALLYGLSIIVLMTVAIMMSIMQNNRRSTSNLVKEVDEELSNIGATSIDSTGGTATTVIADNQSGYYKVEMCSGSTYYSGSVYLEGGETVTGSAGSVTIKNKAGTSYAVMSSGYINGMARFSSNIKKYPFINGQYIPNSGCTNSFRMFKISSEAPFESVPAFDGKGSISAGSGTNVKVVCYNPKSTDKPAVYNGSSNSCAKISEIYVEYNSDGVTSNSVSNVSTGGVHKIKGKFTISRFGPYNSTIANGNYAITPLFRKDSATDEEIKKGTHKYQHTYNPQYTFSTSTYTPSSNPLTDKTDPELVFYGNQSMARPVLITQFASKNSQKWRFEKSGSLYRVSEIEEYKPFEVHKMDTSEGKNGPVLVCGEYTWDTTKGFKSTDFYTGNQNQQWELDSAGAGTFRLKTNKENETKDDDIDPTKKVGPRYLSCECSDPKNYCNGDLTKNRCYVTSKKEDASIFYIFNVDI